MQLLNATSEVQVLRASMAKMQQQQAVVEKTQLHARKLLMAKVSAPSTRMSWVWLLAAAEA